MAISKHVVIGGFCICLIVTSATGEEVESQEGLTDFIRHSRPLLSTTQPSVSEHMSAIDYVQTLPEDALPVLGGLVADVGAGVNMV